MSGSSYLPQGDVVFVAANLESFVVRAIRALESLPTAMPRWALIGGVAVAVNLSGFHRATGDLDSVSLDAGQTVSLLLGAGATRSRSGGVAIPTLNGDALEFDIIDVSEGPADHGSFVAHRYALDTAIPRTISACVVTTTIASVTIPVAGPAAIVAMKVHAIDDRRASRPEKRSGDLYDVIRLVTAFSPAVLARELLTSGDSTLLKSTKDRCTEFFVTDAARSLRLLKTDARSTIAAVDRTDLRIVAEFGDLL